MRGLRVLALPADDSGRANERMSPEDWLRRDAAVVWHGFTQMSCYADNAPVIVERAEGRELIDVAGRRYLDAISSLWVTTLGHRVPELDQALREQIDRVAHSTLLGNGNRTVIELAEALAPRVPVDAPHFLFASDGASAVEQALKIAFQYWSQPRRRRPHALPRVRRRAITATRSAALSLGDGGFGTTVFDPLRFPGAARAGASPTRAASRRACATDRARSADARGGGGRAARAGRGGHADRCRPGAFARARARLPRSRRAARLRRGRHRLRPHGHAVRLRAMRACAPT